MSVQTDYYIPQMKLKDEQISKQASEITRLRAALQRIANGSTSVLISAALDECPINPDVLQEIVKDAVSALSPSNAGAADGS